MRRFMVAVLGLTVLAAMFAGVLLVRRQHLLEQHSELLAAALAARAVTVMEGTAGTFHEATVSVADYDGDDDSVLLYRQDDEAIRVQKGDSVVLGGAPYLVLYLWEDVRGTAWVAFQPQ